MQARAKMSENQVNGAEDEVVSEMIKQLPQEKIIASRSAFRNASRVRWKPQVHGRSWSWCFYEHQHRAITLTSMVSKWYASCIILRLEKKKEPESWNDWNVGGIEAISCQHFQAVMKNLLQKHREWTEDQWLSMAAWYVPQCTWQAWTSRRTSTWRDRSALRELWRGTMSTVGLLLPCWGRRPDQKDWLCFECVESKFSIVAEDGHAGSWQLWNKDERRKEWASFKIWKE